MSGNSSQATRPQFREGTSPIDREELARLLPAGLDGFGPSSIRGDGNSPPMDQEAWMQMMGTLWANASVQNRMMMGNAGAGIPPAQMYGGMPGGYPQQPNHFDSADAMMGGDRGRGGRGRGGRGRGRGGRGGDFGGGFHFNSLATPFNPMGQTSPMAAQGGVRSGWAVVEFKRERVKKYQCPANIPTGEYVIVDGDRGQDCGLVVQVIVGTEDGKAEVTSLDGTNFDGTKLKVEPGRVLRIASEVEVAMLHNEIASLERAALKQCRQRVKESGFDFEVIDCEYQFDRKKISFFFDSDHSIDFRDLVKELYKLFGARIWMENINPGVKNTVPAGALSRHEKAALARAATTRGEVQVSSRPLRGARGPVGVPAAPGPVARPAPTG